MPRRDGFPTNRELQVDFTTVAHDVFVLAAERELEANLPAAFEDKPLDMLYLRIDRRYSLPEDSPEVVLREELNVCANNDDDMHCQLETNELFRDMPEDVKEYYYSKVRHIGSTSLSNSLRFRQILPVEAIKADWDATTRSQYNRHAGTFRERASKQSLVAARYFVDRAMEYVKSEEFDVSMDRRQANFQLGFSNVDPRFAMQHLFSFYISPSLPLNGYESESFLKEYLSAMEVHYDGAVRRIERLEEPGGLGVDQRVIDFERSRAGAYQRAIQSARKFLGNR